MPGNLENLLLIANNTDQKDVFVKTQNISYYIHIYLAGEKLFKDNFVCGICRR